MNTSSLCTIIGMLSLGMSWAQELGNWKAIGGEVKVCMAAIVAFSRDILLPELPKRTRVLQLNN